MLKAWIDHIARSGVTFGYTETGAVGLLHNKKEISKIVAGDAREPNQLAIEEAA